MRVREQARLNGLKGCSTGAGRACSRSCRCSVNCRHRPPTLEPCGMLPAEMLVRVLLLVLLVLLLLRRVIIRRQWQ